MRFENRKFRQKSFWEHRDKWPFDTPDYVFLARAVEILGQFHDYWSPTDATAIHLRPQFQTVVLGIREHCTFGRLVSALQRQDGSLETMPTHVWNNRDFEDWIFDCKAPARAIPRHDWHPLADNPQCWLFIERKGLDALCSAKKPVQKVDRSPKKSVPSEDLHKWIDSYFSQFTAPRGPTYRDVMDAFRAEFPGASTTPFRDAVWDKRPDWMQRRAPKGA